MFEGIMRRPGSYFRVWPHFYINKPDIVGRSIQLLCCVIVVFTCGTVLCAVGCAKGYSFGGIFIFACITVLLSSKCLFFLHKCCDICICCCKILTIPRGTKQARLRAYMLRLTLNLLTSSNGGLPHPPDRLAQGAQFHNLLIEWLHWIPLMCKGCKSTEIGHYVCFVRGLGLFSTILMIQFLFYWMVHWFLSFNQWCRIKMI